MKREILISGSPRETRVAILEDDRLVELLVDRPDTRRSVGDIYLGKVEAVLPGIQAAFVDIGAEKSAFLHASDLIESEEDEEPEDRADDDNGNGNGDEGEGPNGGSRGGRSSRRRAAPNIGDELKRGETKLVQVIKESIGTKGPRVTAQVSLAGRFLVYMPFASKVGVSRKIEARDVRAKLREMVSKLVPKDAGGWIIRTVADDLTEASCKREIDHLYGLWKKIKRKSQSVRAPALIQRETSLTRGIVRDLFSDKVDSLLVDSKQLYNEIEQYLKQIDPELLARVKHYQGETSLFDEYDIEAEIRNLFKQRVELPTGGYLIIQPTEALISIDVNTGRYTGKKDPESTIHRHGDPRQSRQGAAGAAHAPGPRPGAHQGLRRVGAGTDRDDAPASPALVVAIDDVRLSDLQRHRACLPARSRRAADGALAQAGRRRSQGTSARGAAAPRGRTVPRGAGA